MNFQIYLKSIKRLYSSLLQYIENIDGSEEIDFHNLVDIINKHNFLNDYYAFHEFLTLINKISKNYHRFPNFIHKIEKILSYYSEAIKQTFKNLEIFEHFKNNKRIILFLIHEKIITIDDIILNFVDSRNEEYSSDFYLYFFNEIKQYISPEKKNSIENQLLKYNPNIFENFNEKRLNGENDYYICNLIRQDSVEEFVAYINRQNIPLTIQILPSFLETNPFLLKKTPTLIEYAAFYGSIQIFQFLLLNGVYLDSSLWLYAIHSKNGEIIHLLESNRIPPKTEECFIESIKCHHNDIANYIENNYLTKISNKSKNRILRYYNYPYFKQILKEEFPFFNLYKYKHIEIINLYVKKKTKEIKKRLILISNFHDVFNNFFFQ